MLFVILLLALQVRRGQFGTRPAAHKAGAKLQKLAAHNADASFMASATLASQPGSLVERIGERLAEVVDTYGFDMIYFDGLQSMAVLGPFHYTGTVVQRAFARRVKRDVIVQTSQVLPYNWHLNTRAGQTDWAATDSRAFMDYTKADSERSTHVNLMPCDMGWWGYETHNVAFYATTPDELEYMASRAVGWGANPNLETKVASLRANGRTLEGLLKIEPWTRLEINTTVQQFRYYFDPLVFARFHQHPHYSAVSRGLHHTARSSMLIGALPAELCRNWGFRKAGRCSSACERPASTTTWPPSTARRRRSCRLRRRPCQNPHSPRPKKPGSDRPRCTRRSLRRNAARAPGR